MKNFYYVLIIVLLMTAPVCGQVKVLTFVDAVKIALQNSVILNQQKNTLEYSQAQHSSGIAALAPNISLNGSATQFNGNSFNQNAGKVINGIRDNVTGSVNASLNLFSGFGRMNSIRQYAALLDAQNYFVNRTAQDVINTISTQYLQVMLDVELMRIANENWSVQKKQLEQIKEQVVVGSKSPVEEYNQDALTKAAELRFVQAEITLNNDKALLTQTLLIDPFEPFDVEKPQWDITTIANTESDIVMLAERAKQHRGDYLRAVKNETAQKIGLQVYRGLMMPSLIAFANYGSAYNFQHNVPDSISYNGTMILNPDTPRPFSEQFRTNNVYKSYGLQLTIPIFGGLQNKTAFVQQRVQYENSQLTRKNIEFQIKNDVQRAVRNIDGAKKAYTVSIDQLKAADMAFQLETERYNLGVTNFVDYTNANRTLVQAQTDKAQAEYRLIFQRILFDYALGTLKMEDLEEVKN